MYGAAAILATLMTLTGCVGGDLVILTSVGDGCYAKRGVDANGDGGESPGLDVAIAGVMRSHVECPAPAP